MASGRKSASKRSGTKERAVAQVPPTRQDGPQSATGAAIRDAQGEIEVPQGEDRGSKVPIVGDHKPDVEGAPAPQGAQAEPARYTSNGQIPHDTVASPYGAVPVGALALTPEEAEKRVDAAHAAHDKFIAERSGQKRLSPETVHRLGRAELQAIAHRRGYDLNDPEGLMGTRRTRDAFLKAQDEDDEIELED